MLVFKSCGKEALAYYRAVYRVLNAIDFLEANGNINRSGNGVLINKGCDNGTVLRGKLGKLFLDVNRVSSLVGEHAVSVVEIHKGVIVEARGNKLEESCRVGLRLIEVSLVLLYLVDNLIVREVGEVNVLLHVVGGENAVEVNCLKELDKLVEGEVVIVNLEIVYGLGARLEHLELKLVGDKVGLARLDNRLVEHLGNGYLENVGAVGGNAHVNVVGNDLCDLANLVVAAANDARNGEVVVTVLGGYGYVVGELHLLVGHILNLCGARKVKNDILDCACFQNVITVLAEGAVYLDTVNVNCGNVVDEVVVGNFLTLAELNVVFKLIESNCFKSLINLLCEILELLLANVKERVNVGFKGNRQLVTVVGDDTPAGVKRVTGGRLCDGVFVTVRSERDRGCAHAKDHRDNEKHRQNGTKRLFHLLPTFLYIARIYYNIYNIRNKIISPHARNVNKFLQSFLIMSKATKKFRQNAQRYA